jgi:CIC family chloride channel protein
MVPRNRIVAVSPDDSIRRVFHLIDKTLHTGFPVIDGEGRLVGIVALDDIRDRRVNGELPVKGVMSSRVFTVHHACTLHEALNLMVEHDIHHLPVVPVDDPRLLSGFLTRTDIMKAYVRRTSQSAGKGRHSGSITLIKPGMTVEKSPAREGMTDE